MLHGGTARNNAENGARKVMRMEEYDRICAFDSLRRAHHRARRGKREKVEVLRFEEEENYNLLQLQKALENGRYHIAGYNHFMIHDPKVREIQALTYPDRVVQHSLCDEFLGPFIERRLTYDNAACRKNKGTHFALYRLEHFLRENYNRHGPEGWVLKGDIRQYFTNINHEILKRLLYRGLEDARIRNLLDCIIGSFHTENRPGTGLPMGNISSQWFALLYLDPLDRLVKEKLRISHYSRYMDDFVLIHPDKEYLRECLKRITSLIEDDLRLTLNPKTQIFPIKNGVDYLGFHTYVTETGKVIRKLRKNSKARMKRKVRAFNEGYADGTMDYEAIRRSVASWVGHARHGNTYRLRQHILGKLCLRRETEEEG